MDHLSPPAPDDSSIFFPLIDWQFFNGSFQPSSPAAQFADCSFNVATNAPAPNQDHAIARDHQYSRVINYGSPPLIHPKQFIPCHSTTPSCSSDPCPDLGSCSDDDLASLDAAAHHQFMAPIAFVKNLQLSQGAALGTDPIEAPGREEIKSSAANKGRSGSRDSMLFTSPIQAKRAPKRSLAAPATPSLNIKVEEEEEEHQRKQKSKKKLKRPKRKEEKEEHIHGSPSLVKQSTPPRKHCSNRKGGGEALSNAQSHKESKWAQHLLKACACAIAQNNLPRTQHLMWVLNDLSSFRGDTNQRLAAIGLKALFSRVQGRLTLPPILPPSLDLNSNHNSLHIYHALLKFQDSSPWHRAIYTIANGAILETCEGHNKVHIIDIGISQGTQWPTLIEGLATRASRSPALVVRLTIVNDPLLLGSSSIKFVSKLESFASNVGLRLELKNIFTPLECLTATSLDIREGEKLIISTQFRLHQINNEISYNSPCKKSPRDNFLQLLHQLHPSTFVLSDNDVDHSSNDFLTRFQNGMEFQWSFLDSTAVAFEHQDSEARLIIEANAALGFFNNVAFDGSSRIERNETHRTWSLRSSRAGFSCYLPSAEILESAKSLLRKQNCNWDLLIEDCAMVLKWKGQPTTFCSIWRP